jgi:hypothetical protein
MKQVKSLIIAGVLMLTLSVGVYAGDIGTPGAPGDIGTPGAKSTVELVEPNPVVTTDWTGQVSDPVTIEILLALITLI